MACVCCCCTYLCTATDIMPDFICVKCSCHSQQGKIATVKLCIELAPNVIIKPEETAFQGFIIVTCFISNKHHPMYVPDSEMNGSTRSSLRLTVLAPQAISHCGFSTAIRSTPMKSEFRCVPVERCVGVC